MKNFRKVLALVLVVATLFSFTAMTSAAYEDAGKISYDEAVDVLTAVGILNGYEVDEDEYEFKPTQTISREEMAKMIAVLANAGDDVSTLYASANTFADVAKDRWSASYVAYCAKTGIVAGRSASTFDPTGKVTGLETAKMLLVVLGFDAEEQGYVGADWKVNVLRDAKVMGLTNNFAADYDIDVAITREEAAQMMLNALEAPCVVGILSDGIVTLTNALVTNWGTLTGNTVGKLMNITAYGKLKDAMDAGEWCLYGNVVISNDTLASTLYGLKKIASSEKADCYARPGAGWQWVDAKGNVKVYGAYADAPVFSKYNTTTTAIDKFTAGYTGYRVTEYVDGEEADVTAGNGALVEIYEVYHAATKTEKAWKELRVVQINTYIDYIEDVDTYHKTVTIGGHTAKNTFGLTTKDEGKVALYWQCNGKHDKDRYDLHAVELATPVVAKVTKAVKDNANGGNYFIASGDKYEYAVKFNSTLANDYGYIFGEVVDGAAYGVGSEWKIYTDKYGYVMAYVPAASTEYKYAVIDDESMKAYPLYETEKDGMKYKYAGALVEFEADPAVSDEMAFDSSAWTNVDAYATEHDVLVKYYIDDQGEVAVEADWQTGRSYGATDEVLKNNTVIDIDDAYVTDSTQILLRVKNLMTGKYEYKYFDGQSDVDAKYQLTYAQKYVKNNKITYLYAEANYVLTSATAYIMGDRTSEVYLTDGNKVVGYNTYAAIVDGKEAVIATTDHIDEDLKQVFDMNMVWIGLTTDGGDPVYVEVSGADALVKKDGVVATIDATDGLLIIGNKAAKLDKDAQFVLVFTDGWGDEDFDVMTAADIIEYTNDWDHVYVWTDDVDGDGDEDVIYVNAECGIKNHTADDHE